MKKQKKVTPHIRGPAYSQRCPSFGFFSDSTGRVPPARTLLSIPFGRRLLVSGGWRCHLASQAGRMQELESNVRRHHFHLAARDSVSHLSPVKAGRSLENGVRDGRALPDHATRGDGDMLLAKSCNDTVPPRDLSKGTSPQSYLIPQSCLILENKGFDL